METIVNCGLFPGTWSTYELDDYEEIILIDNPREKTSNDIKLSKIPALLIPYPRGSPFLIIQAHGNGSDLGMIYERMYRIANIVNAHVLAFEYPG